MTSSVEAFQLPHGDLWYLSYFRAWAEYHCLFHIDHSKVIVGEAKCWWVGKRNPVCVQLCVDGMELYPLPGDWVVKNGDKWEVRTDAQWGRQDRDEN